ncbi:hypothetical protein [Burkholderia vietnamiensis]|uniref:hypothetical protein n=1 Tax=Burkholderia vietnamiensis TaxID=60552 RepID=UPI0012D9170D|nr:hypothetical protein [Burkholderia vietnamiensis]
MTKVRLFEIRCRDGHGNEWSEYAPANNKETVAAEYAHPHIATQVNHLGYFDVTPCYGGQQFEFEVNGIRFTPESRGYDFLLGYMSKELAAFAKHLRKVDPTFDQ